MPIASAATAALIVIAVLCSAFGTETTLVLFSNLMIALGVVSAVCLIFWAIVSGK